MESRIDSHKWMYHPEWVAKWKEARSDWEVAKKLYPVYIEITPIEYCNHRCTFCALDYVGHRAISLNKEVFRRILADMAEGGVKSVMFAGEGEPTLYRNLPEIIKHTKELGVDVSLTTNGTAMNKKFLAEALAHITWLKVSLDAGEKDTYLKIHRPRSNRDWERILENLKEAVRLKKECGYACWIGVQALLLPPTVDEKKNFVPGNINELRGLARTLKKLGVDAFVVKPYSHQPASLTAAYKEVLYGNYSWLQKELMEIATSNFAVEYRSNAIQKYSEARPYDVCMAVPFATAHIMADGSLYSCSAHLLNQKFYLGNINKQSFREIWEGEYRREVWEVMKTFNLSGCRRNCRMDETNRYLWEVIHPPYNVNFI